MASLVIVTDLDGTLLDHSSYSFDAAIDALSRIRSLGYPLILNSSKTSAEIQAVQKQLGIAAPYISENGAAVFWFQDGVLESEVFAPSRDKVLDVIHSLRTAHGYQFTGFDDCAISEIVAMTGLDHDSALLAAARDFTEPLLWSDSEQRFEMFKLQLLSSGLQVMQGGRFFTVMGLTDKSIAFKWVVERFRQPGAVITVALGDSPNDEDMLNNADIAVVIRSQHSSKLRIAGPEWIIRTQLPGPQGWQQAMAEILEKYV